MKTPVLTLQREPTLVLEEVRRLLGDGFNLPDFNLDDDISKLDRMLSQKDFFEKGLASSVIDDFPTQKEIYQHRLAEVEEAIRYQASFLSRVSAVLKAGYSPFTVNKTWFCGLLETEQDAVVYEDHREEIMGVRHVVKRGFFRDIHEEIKKIGDAASKKYLLFNQVFPKAVWEKYQIAKNLGIFDVILIHSPASDDFIYVCDEKIVAVREQVNITKIVVHRLDPVLIGYIANGAPSQIKFKEGNNEFYFTRGEEKVISFMIAIWDLGKDLQVGQI